MIHIISNTDSNMFANKWVATSRKKLDISLHFYIIMIADRDVNAAKNILKVGYNNKNQDKDMVLQKVNGIDVVYDRQIGKYKVNVYEV